MRKSSFHSFLRQTLEHIPQLEKFPPGLVKTSDITLLFPFHLNCTERKHNTKGIELKVVISDFRIKLKTRKIMSLIEISIAGSWRKAIWVAKYRLDPKLV